MKSTREKLTSLLDSRIILLDGAMGTMIQSYELSEEDYRGNIFSDWSSDLKGNNDLLSITQPEIISNIHKAFLEAGSHIIETNTFNSNAPSMADYAMEDRVYELNLVGAKVARDAADAHTKSTGKEIFLSLIHI